ncbi:MAG: DNA repair protein RecN [Calditrichia bacterium]
MLKHLRIRNFALAHQLELEFNPGLTIITGETGAGKSILVGAISAVLGDRVFTEVVRTGEEKATVEAIFSIPDKGPLADILREKGLDQGDELFLRREIYSKGNTRAFVNDSPVPINTLAEIGEHLMDIHSQNQHQSLLKKETHVFFLDSYGQHQPLLAKVAEAYRKYQNLRSEFNSLQNRQNDLNEKYELYQFQVHEIDGAGLTPGEEEELESERNILVNAEKIYTDASAFSQILNSNDGPDLLTLFSQAQHLLKNLSEFSEELKNIHEEFTSARIIADEALRSVEEFRNSVEFDPVRLETIEERLTLISRLKKKYGDSVEEILAYRDKIGRELNLKENFDFEIEQLNKKLNAAHQEYIEQAEKLSELRRETAAKLEEAVEKQLHQIGMAKTRFQVHFGLVPAPEGLYRKEEKNYLANENGFDDIEFYISPNPGEDFKPLAKIASGGEISRIMLALKNILAEVDQIPSLIFDEIDAGISGAVASAVGKSIHRLAGSHQILCITHLPQIAAYGHTHFQVSKFVENGRTFTQIKSLNSSERVEEIARLIGGNQLNEVILKSAAALLEEAQNV